MLDPVGLSMESHGYIMGSHPWVLPPMGIPVPWDPTASHRGTSRHPTASRGTSHGTPWDSAMRDEGPTGYHGCRRCPTRSRGIWTSWVPAVFHAFPRCPTCARELQRGVRRDPAGITMGIARGFPRRVSPTGLTKINPASAHGSSHRNSQKNKWELVSAHPAPHSPTRTHGASRVEYDVLL